MRRRNRKRLCGCGGTMSHTARQCGACRGLLSHGLSRTPEYRAWQTMRHRCTQPTSPAWKRYGGRGITICAGWLNSPAQFITDVGQRPSKQHELDRKDNDLGYWCGRCPECRALQRAANCHWVTRSANDRNTRRNTLIIYQGKRWVLAALAEAVGVRADRISARIKRGWPVEEAVSQVPFTNGTQRAKSSASSSKPKAT